MHIHDDPSILDRVRETVAVYLACTRLTAGSLYVDGLLDAVEALGGSRDDPPIPVARLLAREQDVAGEALGPILDDLEARLAELRRECAAPVAHPELALAAG